MSKRLMWIPTTANRAEAAAYVAWTNANSPFYPGLFTVISEFDPCPEYPSGALTCAFLGPNLMYNYQEVPEPEAGPSMRPNALGPGDFPPPEEE